MARMPSKIRYRARANPEQVEGITEDGVFTADKIESRFQFLGVPKLTAFSLPDRVVGKNNETAFDQIDVQDLIGGGRLAHGRVAAGTDNRGTTPRDCLWCFVQ